MLDIRITNQELTAIQADVLILPQVSGAEINVNIDAVKAAVDAGDFKADFGQTAVFYTGGAYAARKVLLLGLGKAEKLNLRTLRRAAGIGAREARKSGAKSVAFGVSAVVGLTETQTAQMMAEGALHGLYRFETFKSEAKPQPQVETLTFVGGPEVEAGVKVGQAIGEGVNAARSVNWLPGNKLTATILGEKAKEVAAEAGFEIEVYDKKGCEELGLGLLLSVNQGSKEEPRFIVMRYQGAGKNAPWLALVGKGVTFDTGGISIKPTEGMWDMKFDMSGAGAVLGAVKALGQTKPKANIMAIIGATDNMPDGNSYKPGDVISGLSGRTVEVRSTDAEGRLVLGDAVAYAEKQGAAKIITAATLTGAVQIALGPVRFGMVANDNAWEAEVYEAAEEAGERGWRLPNDEEYYDFFKSPIADMANSGTARAAGTVVGGLFIMKHLKETPCVHLDIASLAWERAGNTYEDAGATGVAVRTMVRAAHRFAEANS